MVNNTHFSFEAYNGENSYIAAFCAKNDFDKMFNVLEPLHKKGYNIWYDEENFNTDSLSLSSLYKFLDPECREVFVFLSPESEKSQVIIRLLAYITRAEPQNVYFILLEQELGENTTRETASYTKFSPDIIESFISNECKSENFEAEPVEESIEEKIDEPTVELNDEKEVPATPPVKDSPTVNSNNFIYEKIPDGVKILGYSGYDKDIFIPNLVEGFEVTEISGFVFSPKAPVTITVPSSVKAISISAFSFKNENVTIKCENNSYAYKFANTNNIKYVVIDQANIISSEKKVEQRIAFESSAELNVSEHRRRNLKLDKNYKEPYIFFSFSQKDFPEIRPIIEKMTCKGFRIYIPEYYENLTEEEISEIEEKIAKSRYFIAFISENYTKDRFLCHTELRAVEVGNTEYYPIVLDSTQNYPAPLNSDIEKNELKKSNFSDDNSFFDAIIRPIKQCRGNFFMDNGDFKFKIENNKVILKKYLGSDETVVINSSYLYTPIVEIGEFAFSNCTSVKEIVLPETVRLIGGFAFSGCVRLKRIVLPESLEKLGSFSFSGCKALSSIVIPNLIENISNNTFNECSALETVVLPEGLKTIESYAFRGCSVLSEIRIPSSVTQINDYAFSKCPLISEQTLLQNNNIVHSSALSSPKKISFTIDENDPNQFDYYKEVIYKENLSDKIKNYLIRLMYK